jgi:hypothetical protein
VRNIFSIIKQNIIGIVVGVIGLISAGLSYLYKGNLDSDMMSYRVFFSLLTIVLIVIITQFLIIIKLAQLPFMRETIKVKNYNNRIDEFIIDPSTELSINTIACLYFIDGDYDIFVGIGIITNNTSKICQLKISSYNSKFVENYPEVFEKVKLSDRNTLNSLIIKSQITNEAIIIGGF